MTLRVYLGARQYGKSYEAGMLLMRSPNPATRAVGEAMLNRVPFTPLVLTNRGDIMTKINGSWVSR